MTRAIALALLLLALRCDGAPELKPFDAKSLDRARAMLRGRPFVIALWSVTCEPCREEMPLWRAMRQKYPGIQILLVSADAPRDRSNVVRFLARYDPGSVERWLFSDDFSERLRYSIDRSWRGELPRTYFYDAEHHAVARSGVLDPAETEAWFARNAALNRASR